MSYLEPPQESDPAVARLYAEDRERLGYVANYTRALAHRPGAIAAWQGLGQAIKGAMDLRRFELATLAAARRLGSDYCTLAHEKVLRDRFYDAAEVRRIAEDRHGALPPVDAAVMDFAERVASDPNGITADDVEALRRHGLSDPEILDVALAAAARCFFSTVIAAMGAEPDPALRAAG
ncbi:carboxymuconolactone decarboxylase family protein [Dactylosporangium sp. CA-139066]|uniref:carboxymuconolactone decarboxylase family protein n=1 Tax=Dactylosporangium sp. CA-139066 TaxID=3239930 RepID=UPI003D90529A